MRQVELHRERVILRRALHGMRMAISVNVSDFRGLSVRCHDQVHSLVLTHRDPALSIPLFESADAEEFERASQMWSKVFALPCVVERSAEPAPRRRRRNVLQKRRPKFLVRRRAGAPLGALAVHSGEREIIAPE